MAGDIFNYPLPEVLEQAAHAFLPIIEVIKLKRLSASARERIQRSLTHFAWDVVLVAPHDLASICLHKLLEQSVSFRSMHLECASEVLWEAAKVGFADVVALLLERAGSGVNVNAKEPTFGQTPLHLAAKGGHLEVVDVLLRTPSIELNVEYWSRGYGDITPFEEAVRVGHLGVVEALLADSRLDVGAMNSTYPHPVRSPLCCAATNGHLNVIKALLADSRFNDGAMEPANPYHWRSPLCYAAASGHLEVVEALLQVPGKYESAAWDAALQAAEAGHTSVVEALLRLPYVNVNARKRGDTLLVVAAKYGHLEVVEMLLKVPNIDTWSANDAVPDAAHEGHSDVVEVLLKVPNICMTTMPVYRAVRNAANKGHSDIVKMLLNAPNINIRSACAAALRGAIYYNHPAVLEVLLPLRKSVDWNRKNEFESDRTVLHTAVHEGHREVVEILLNAPLLIDVDVNAVDDRGATPLHLAVETKDERRGIVEALLSHDLVDMNARCQDKLTGVGGMTPLLAAVRYAPDDIVELLLEHAGLEIVVNFADDDGVTPLRHAIEADDEYLVELLVEIWDIDLYDPDRRGETVLGFARRLDRVEIVAILEQALAVEKE